MTGIRKFIALAGAAAIALGTSGCNKVAGAGASDPGAVQSAIKADEKKWNDQFKSKDMEGCCRHYADDAFFIAPGVPAADGATAVRKAYADGLNDKNFEHQFRQRQDRRRGFGRPGVRARPFQRKVHRSEDGPGDVRTRGPTSPSTRSRRTEAGRRSRTSLPPNREARSRLRRGPSPKPAKYDLCDVTVRRNPKRRPRRAGFRRTDRGCAP